MNIILFDNTNRQGLYPLTLTCAVAEIRAGIFTIKERWQMLTGANVFVHTAPYLQPLYGNIPGAENLWIDAAVLADNLLAEKILGLAADACLIDDRGLVAGRFTITATEFDAVKIVSQSNNSALLQNVRRLKYPWQIFQWNDAMIREDFALARSKKVPQPLPGNNQYINEADIFIEEGATVAFSILNASAGPVYIAKGATIMEGSLIRGPFALCEGAAVKMGTKIYGATTIGPYCMVGGEIKNSIMQAYSNKGHDGYLGDAVIGRWCNLGAGTSNSNVKNTAGEVKMWSYETGDYIPVGTKAGVIMGDYSRTAINTSINTGTVTGICCNIFDGGLTPKNIPSFSWGGRAGGTYRFDKALEDIANWKKMKHHILPDAEKAVLKHIFEAL